MNPLQPLRAALDAPPPVIVLVGPEALLVREAEELVRARLVSGPFAALNLASFGAGDEGAASFAVAAGTTPMMASRRVVELRHVQDANAALLDALLAYAASPCPTTVLVVSGDRFPAASGGVDRGLRFQNAVKKVGLLLKFERGTVDPVAFALERARAAGVRIARDAGEALVEFGGGDLSVLAADVDKCVDFVGAGGAISREVVEEVIAYVAGADAWGLPGAIVARDADTALSIMHRQLEDGEEALKLMGSLVWQLRQVLLVQDAARRGLNERDAGVRMPPQKARQVREMVSRRPISPSAMLDEIATVERAMKSSRAGSRRVFERFVLRLTLL